MKKTLNLVLLSFVLGQPLSLLLSDSQPALAGTHASDCVKGVLYSTGVSEQTAAIVCKGVTTEQELNSVQDCVKSLLYDTKRNSWRSGSRTERNSISEETAATTCSIASSVQPGQVIVAPPGSVIQQSNQQFANCINKQMFREREVCIDPWGRVEDDCFFDKRRETITESTGITFEQASAMCGG